MTDVTVKMSRKSMGVIPAKAGIHFFQIVKKVWIPFFNGMTTFCSDIMTGEMLIAGIKKAAPYGHGLLCLSDDFAVMSGLVGAG